MPSSVSGAKRRGVGVGVHGNADVGEDVSEAYVRLDPNGTAIIHSGLAEHGTGQRSNICKMVAEILQLPLERVFVSPNDSRVNPYEMGPVGSRGTYAIGSAVIAAAEDAKTASELSAPVQSKSGRPGDGRRNDLCEGNPMRNFRGSKRSGMSRPSRATAV